MVIYILLALLFFLLRNQDNKFVQIVCVGLLFLIGAFRAYTVGTDTANTLLVYEGVGGMVSKKGEYGLGFLTNYLINHNYSMRWELIITQAIFIGSLSWFCIKRDRQSFILTMLLFILCGYIYMSYNITRQMIAFSLTIWAFYNRERGQHWIFFVLVIILAMLIHTSAIIVFLVASFDKFHLSKVITIVTLVITFLIPQFVSMDSILEFFVSRMDLLSRFDFYIGFEQRSTFSITRLMMNIFFIYILALYHLHIKGNIYFKALIIGLVILNLFPYSPIITRMGLYFTAIQPIFLADFFKYAHKEGRILAATYVIAVYANFLLSNNGGVVPYEIGGF